MGLNRTSSGVLDQESSGVPTPTHSSGHSVFKRMLASSRAKFLAVCLSVGASSSLLPPPLSDPKVSSAQEPAPRDTASLNSIRHLLQHHPDISSVTLDEHSIQCVVKGTIYTGILNANGHLSAMSSEGINIEFNTPIEGTLIGSVLHNIHHMRVHLPPLEKDHIRQFSSPDGVRFLFTEKHDHGTEMFVALPTMLLKIIEQPKESAFLEWKASAQELEENQKNIRTRLQDALTDENRSEWQLREKNEWLEKRLKTISDKITSILEKYREHPYRYIDEAHNIQNFHKEIDPLWEACQANPHRIGFSAYQKRLNALQRKLEPYEKLLSLAPGLSTIEGIDALNSLERVERSKAINDRYENIRLEFQKRLSSAETSEESHTWQQKWFTLRQEWDDHVTRFAQEFGWQTWDPTPIALQKHRTSIQKMDDLLTIYEKTLDLIPPLTSNAIITQFDQERTLLQQQITREKLLKKQAYRLIGRTVSDNREVTLSPDPLYPRTFYIRYADQSGIVIEKYAQTKKEFRTWHADDGQSRTHTSTNNNGFTYHNQWNRKEGGPWILAKQTRFRADGTIEWVSDAVQDHLEYFAADGKRLARMEYEDGGKSITRVSFFGKDNKEFSTFDREKESNEQLTRGEYLDRLAKELDTNEKLHAFLDIFMQYTYDNGDYWQSAQETVERVIGSRMRGDCDDYAFLARAILRRQGKNAHVVSIPYHATCIWVEKRPDGRFDAYDIGTFGLDKNGNRYGYAESPEREQGYTTIIDALNALMVKFRYPGLGLREGQNYTLNENNIWFLEIYQNGNRVFYRATVNTFIEK